MNSSTRIGASRWSTEGRRKSGALSSAGGRRRAYSAEIGKGIYSDENVRPNEIWMAVKVFPNYVRGALINQGAEGAWKGIL